MAEILFDLFVYGSWDDEPDHTEFRTLKIDEEDRSRLRSFDDKKILGYLKENCVGKCNTISGSEEYFIPRVKFGNLEASLQVNYYIWSHRTDQNPRYLRGAEYESYHGRLISAEEFDEVIPDTEKVIDVAFYLNDCRISMGQMSISEVGKFFVMLAEDQHPMIEDRP